MLEWRNLSVHVPPMRVPQLSSILDEVDVEAMRAAATVVRRRLLWTSIYGSCHLAEGEGGGLDAFDTLMEARPRARARAHAHAHAHAHANAHAHAHAHTYVLPPSLTYAGAAPAAHTLQAVSSAQRAACPRDAGRALPGTQEAAAPRVHPGLPVL